MAGGSGGNAFDDLTDDIVGIRRIKLWHGGLIDGIEITYVRANGLPTGPIHHGGFGGNQVSTVELGVDEYITEVFGFTNNWFIDRLGFIVKEPSGEERMHGPFGTSGTYAYSFKGYIVAFHGGAGDRLDGLGAYFLDSLETSPLYGGTGGDEWSDPVTTSVPAVVRRL